jgi:hypothetical protein
MWGELGHFEVKEAVRNMFDEPPNYTTINFIELGICTTQT